MWMASQKARSSPIEEKCLVRRKYCNFLLGIQSHPLARHASDDPLRTVSSDNFELTTVVAINIVKGQYSDLNDILINSNCYKPVLLQDCVPLDRYLRSEIFVTAACRVNCCLVCDLLECVSLNQSSFPRLY